MKRQSSEWKKIFANKTTDKRLISKIYRQLRQFNIKKTNLRENVQIDISPKKTCRWPTNT